MAKNITAAYSALRSRLASLDGLRSAPEYPIERPSIFPLLEMGRISGRFENFSAAGQPLGEHTFKWKIHVNRSQGLPKALEELLPFAERVASSLMYDGYKLGGTIDGVVRLSYTHEPSAIGDVDTVCFDYELVVKILGVG